MNPISEPPCIASLVLVRKGHQAGFGEAGLKREKSHGFRGKDVWGIQIDTGFAGGNGLRHGNRRDSFLRIHD